VGAVGRRAGFVKNSDAETSDSVDAYSSAMAQIGFAQSVGIALVDALFNVPPVRMALALVARIVLADNARRFGVDWRASASKWRHRRAELSGLVRRLQTPQRYPTYYRRPFHAYESGNLCWEAAFEVEAASLALTLRYWPNEVKQGKLKAAEAQDRMRRAIVGHVKAYWHILHRHSRGPNTVCDLGCGVGISTEYLAHAHHDTATSITGIDLSPNYLAIAKARANDATNPSHSPIPFPTRAPPSRNKPTTPTAGAAGTDRALPAVVSASSLKGDALKGARAFSKATFVHGAAESVDQILGTHSTDLIYASFLVHELPADATRAVLKSAAKALRPGGVIAIADIDVERMVQRSSPALVALFQVTEPFFKEYARLDLHAELAAAGFTDVQVVPTDPKNRLVLARRATF